jgi:acyl-coenzyme A thioesterase PaaI-like protein
LRFGNTLCGPDLKACADTAMAIAIMGIFGDFRNVATVSLNVDFMRPIGAVDVRIGATVRNQGRSLTFTECNFVPAAGAAIAVHATATWAVVPSISVGA